MDYQLVVVRGRSASTTIALADGVTSVGRQDDCQLRIKSSQVSRKHCEIFEKKGLLLVKDLGSSNGTFVNGKRIAEQRVLEPGDELTIGQVTLKVTKVGAAPSAAPAKPAGKPGDTAVVAPAAAAGAEDEFDIDFDLDVDSAPAAEPPKPAPAVEVTAPHDAAPATPPEPEHAPAAAVDDAVADFLLDIKFDEEE